MELVMSGHGCEELSTDQIILERNILLFMSSTVLFKPTKHFSFQFMFRITNIHFVTIMLINCHTHGPSFLSTIILINNHSHQPSYSLTICYHNIDMVHHRINHNHHKCKQLKLNQCSQLVSVIFSSK